jgi:hypothetical protein
MNCFSSLIKISLSRLDGNHVCCAAGCCILPGIAASPVAVRPGSAKSTIGASASVAPATVAVHARTPPSSRFLGRKVYLATMVVLIAIMREGATAARMRRLSGLLGVDRRTVERWRAWLRDTSCLVLNLPVAVNDRAWNLKGELAGVAAIRVEPNKDAIRIAEYAI